MTVDLPAGRTVAWCAPGVEPAVVCLHGAGVSSRELLPLVSALDGIRQAWSIDLPGFGASSGPKPPLSLSDLAHQLRFWLDETGTGPVHLLGSSFGCQVAAEITVCAPEYVRSCTLVGPTVDPSARTFLRQLWRWIRNSPHEPRTLSAQVLRDYRDAVARRVSTAFSAALADRIEDKLPHVTVPALVVRGENDGLVPQAWAEEATRLLEQGRLVVWPGSEHMVPFSHPEGLAELVATFADEVDG